MPCGRPSTRSSSSASAAGRRPPRIARSGRAATRRARTGAARLWGGPSAQCRPVDVPSRPAPERRIVQPARPPQPRPAHRRRDRDRDRRRAGRARRAHRGRPARPRAAQRSGRGRRPRDPARDRRGSRPRRACVGTPERVHRMYTELTAGYHVDPERLINGAIFDVALQRDGRRQGHPVLLALRAPPAAVLRHGGGRLHPARPGHRPVEDPAHRRDVRPPAPGPGAAHPADRRVPPGPARAAGRRRRHRGDPPVRGHARRPQARHDHDDLVGAGAVPDA